ncbi:MAG: U32 family peptidase [Cephaloticoccus sp.]|nr:U32 family peptidase [Cephaloticoccus sp.]MCF7758975.1 U32 family peptidase [Cephaloticoccus sp.]
MSDNNAMTAPEVDPRNPAVWSRPEILAPAGDWDCVRAAVENGADAIYFGLERFNARMRAKNFTQADLPALMEFLHKRGVRGYVTFNTLVFADELASAEDYLKGIIASGVDAAIVQDIGICRLIRRLSPDFPIHTSTQMTISCAAGVEFARELGAQLVVLARENSIKEILAIQAAQKSAPLPLEVFVHGALCVAYSGQCLTSEALGGRSANRGECAQACRMPYELVSDGQKVNLGDRKYLLSPQDLSGLEVLPDMVRAGVASLKIEGRLKAPEYVASITRVYRQALDKVMAELSGEPTPPFEPKSARYELEMSFSRGLYTGWFRGINNQELAHGRFGTKRGVYLGEITRVQGEAVHIRLQAHTKPGDGIVFDDGKPESGEEGGRIYQVETGVGDSVLHFGHGDINFNRVRAGQRVWKTNDPALDREVRKTFAGDKIRFQRSIDVEVHGRVGIPLTLIVNDRTGHVVRLDSNLPLEVATQHPLTTERLRDQLGRLGGTPFQLDRLDNQLEDEVIIPLSELNRLRRDAVAELASLRARPKRWALHAGRTGNSTLTAKAPSAPASPVNSAPEIIAVIRNLDQLAPAWSTGARTLYCEFENPKHYREAVAAFRELQRVETTGSSAPSAATIWVAPPRIFKPGEEWILQQVRSCAADGFLVRHHEHLRFFAADRKRGDFSLNVANPLTAEYFLQRYGLERVTASYDLNISQLEALLSDAPGSWFDITIHQHMPMFHMEHCVFCAFLSEGKDYRDCGRPCDTHRVALRDRVGAELPLRADAGCRNTVFNNRAQTGAEYVQRLLDLGARTFRVEFINESPAEVTRTLQSYQRLLRGEINGTDLWRELKLLNQLGVTRGQMDASPQVIHRKQ